MSKLIKFPSIEQFRNVIKHVRDNAAYHQVSVPKVTFTGTVKLHGTNSAICYDPSTQEMWTQSRENVITPEKDNAGFSMWVHGKREIFKQMFKFLQVNCPSDPGDIIQVFGEWCGGSIQKGVGLNQLPKMFVIFGLRISVDGESQDWVTPERCVGLFASFVNGADIFHIYQFPHWEMTIDFTRPELSQNKLIELTIAVEDRCPVANQLLGDKAVGVLVGEGIVWEAKCAIDSPINVAGLRFKVKGEKHSVSKVKTIASVDVEKVNTVNEFADNVCTVSRFEQALDKMKIDGLDSVDVKNTGAFIKLVCQDCAKEEMDTISGNNLTWKEVASAIATRSRQYYLSLPV